MKFTRDRTRSNPLSCGLCRNSHHRTFMASVLEITSCWIWFKISSAWQLWFQRLGININLKSWAGNKLLLISHLPSNIFINTKFRIHRALKQYVRVFYGLLDIDKDPNIDQMFLGQLCHMQEHFSRKCIWNSHRKKIIRTPSTKHLTKVKIIYQDIEGKQITVLV